MKRFLAVALLLIPAWPSAAQDTANLVRLRKGTPILLKMAQSLNSKHAYIGERVEMQVAEDVVIDWTLVIPRGTRVLGTVIVGKKDEGSKKNPHQVALRVDYIRLGDRRIALSGGHADKGKVSKGTVVTSTVLLGVTGLMVALNARTGKIAEGTEVQAFVAEDVELPALRAVPVRPGEGKSAPPAEAQEDRPQNEHP